MTTPPKDCCSVALKGKCAKPHTTDAPVQATLFECYRCSNKVCVNCSSHHRYPNESGRIERLCEPCRAEWQDDKSGIAARAKKREAERAARVQADIQPLDARKLRVSTLQCGSDGQTILVVKVAGEEDRRLPRVQQQVPRNIAALFGAGVTLLAQGPDGPASALLHKVLDLIHETDNDLNKRAIDDATVLEVLWEMEEEIALTLNRPTALERLHEDEQNVDHLMDGLAQHVAEREDAENLSES